MKQNNIFTKLLPVILFMLAVMNAKSEALSDNVYDISAKNGMQIGLVGEFNFWGQFGYADHLMTQSTINPNLWTATIVLTNDMNYHDAIDIIEVKFRVNEDWTTQWSANTFPTGFGYQDGPNIPVPIDLNAAEDIYYVSFDTSTGEYSFSKYPTPVPISTSGVYLGIMLIIGFLVFRFRKVF